MHEEVTRSATVVPLLSARYCSTQQSLSSAREEYRLLRSQEIIDVRALRKAAKRVYDLEQEQAVLARELAQTRME